MSVSRPIAIGNRNPTSRPLVLDIGILGGVVLSNVLFDRVIRPNFHPFMIALARTAYSRWIRTRGQINYILIFAEEFSHLVRQYARDKKDELARIVTLRLYPFIFEKVRGLYIWMNTRPEFGNKRFDSVPQRLRGDRHLERASFRFIPKIDECELDDCNEDGFIHAYEKSESTSDTESEEFWSQMDRETEEADVGEDFEAGSNGEMIASLTSFNPPRTCSTPVKLTFPNTVDSFQLQQSEAKVAALETQLNEMKAMIALILENQNRTLVNETSNKTIIADTNAPKPAIPNCAPPLPPPPPPPPMPQLSTSATTPTPLKLKVGRRSGSLGSSNTESSTRKAPEPEVKSMTDVLKGLSNVKLRPTQRSPGGTPFKRQKTLSPNDASNMIALALKKRFARIHSPSDSEPEDDRRRSYSNKENSGDDSFDNSPLFHKPRKSGQGLPKRASLFPPPNEEDLKNTVIPEVNESSLEEDTLKFGQFLLKPSKKKSSTVLRQSNTNKDMPLRQQSQNVN